MLPPGHTAAGFLVSYGLLELVHPNITPLEYRQLLLVGAFFGFAPDLDMFYAFVKARGFTIPGTKINHRSYLSHTPIVWLVAGLIITLLAQHTFWQLFGIMIWLGSWSHFILDSFKVGVRWFYPFSKKFFAFHDPGQREDNQTKGFLAYWLHFLKRYTTESKFRTTFVLEVIILVSAAAVLIRIHS